MSTSLLPTAATCQLKKKMLKARATALHPNSNHLIASMICGMMPRSVPHRHAQAESS